MSMRSLKKKTLCDLREVALGLLKGIIYTDLHIDKEEDLSNIFHKLQFLTDREEDLLPQEDIALLYEYMREAYCYAEDYETPAFLTFQTLTREESLCVAEMFLRYKAFLDTYVEVEISES